MTNKDAIEILRNGFTFSSSSSGFINGSNALIMAINSLEENTKLNAKIEQLQSTNTKLYEEIAELKGEQSK